MLHISSSRLQHVQGFVFTLLEEAPCFPEPFLEVFFLYHCCAVFLNTRVILLDTNKLALAARSLCLLVSFYRRVLLHSLAKLACAGSAQSGRKVDDAQRPACRDALEHLEALLAALPELCDVLLPMATGRGCQRLHDTGLWKLAVETLIYLIEDTLPALSPAGAEISREVAAAYWAAVVNTLRQVVSAALPARAATGDTQGSDGTPGEPEFLVQAVGNLLVHRILPCKVAPEEVSEQAVRLLGDLVALQSRAVSPLEGNGVSVANTSCDSGAAANGLEPHVALGYLFDLCLDPRDSNGGTTSGGSHAVEESIAAMTARGGRIPHQHAWLPDRGAVLGTAVPALIAHLRAVLSAGCDEVGEAGAAHLHRVEEVRFALARLKGFHADESVLQALIPVLQGDRAQAVCRLAGPRCFTMALLPQLSALGTSGDAQIRKGVQDVLQGLASGLGL